MFTYYTEFGDDNAKSYLAEYDHTYTPVWTIAANEPALSTAEIELADRVIYALF